MKVWQGRIQKISLKSVHLLRLWNDSSHGGGACRPHNSSTWPVIGGSTAASRNNIVVAWSRDMTPAVESAKRALWSLLRSQREGGSAKLTISTVKGNLRVNLEQTFPPVRRNVANWMPKKSKGGSYRRRQERRASDQLVQQRAAAHRD